MYPFFEGNSRVSVNQHSRERMALHWLVRTTEDFLRPVCIPLCSPRRGRSPIPRTSLPPSPGLEVLGLDPSRMRPRTSATPLARHSLPRADKAAVRGRRDFSVLQDAALFRQFLTFRFIRAWLPLAAVRGGFRCVRQGVPQLLLVFFRQFPSMRATSDWIIFTSVSHSIGES